MTEIPLTSSLALPVYIFFTILGAIIGSFLNALIWRWPREESLQHSRSKCIHCGTQLTWFELLPIVSYIFQRGKCTTCKASIPLRYLLVELVTAGLFLITIIILPLQSTFDYFFVLRTLLVICALIIIFAVDLEHYIILDSVLWRACVAVVVCNFILDIITYRTVGAGFSLLYSYTVSGIFAAGAACLAFYGLHIFSKGRWLGFGDVKLVILLGLFLGWPMIWLGLLLGFWLGAIVGVGLIMLGKKTLSSRVPFGTFLAVATIIIHFWGNSLLHWYINLISF